MPADNHSESSSTNTPLVVFCTTCKGRTPHLSQTLPKNLAGNRLAKFIVLDFNSPDNLANYLLSNHAADIASGRLVVFTLLPGPDGPVAFHMARAKNMAHRLGILEGADILVNLDADGYAGDGFDTFILDRFQAANEAGEKILLQALWNRWVDQPDGSREWMAQDGNGVFGEPVPKGSNGRMVVTANAFLLAGGYDEKYSEWSPDDKDFNIRLRRLGYAPRLLDRRFQETILHNDKIRFKDYPHAVRLKSEDDFRIAVEDSAETVVNAGRVGCGVVFRNFDFANPIELGPIPTRIFGVGLHKTATTSLHQALTILGYDSAHWKDAHWAKKIWDEMTATGKSITLERSYCLSDLPISILYRELDKAYPGSRFILTVRDESSWLRSVRDHWNPDLNPFRSQWDGDPFTHIIHKQVYGRRDFHAETFLARYRRHNAEVMEYFKGRPEDLLVLSAPSWAPLCEFLGKPVPDVEYPRAFPTPTPVAAECFDYAI